MLAAPLTTLAARERQLEWEADSASLSVLHGRVTELKQQLVNERAEARALQNAFIQMLLGRPAPDTDAGEQALKMLRRAQLADRGRSGGISDADEMSLSRRRRLASGRVRWAEEVGESQHYRHDRIERRTITSPRGVRRMQQRRGDSLAVVEDKRHSEAQRALGALALRLEDIEQHGPRTSIAGTRSSSQFELLAQLGRSIEESEEEARRYAQHEAQTERAAHAGLHAVLQRQAAHIVTSRDRQRVLQMKLDALREEHDAVVKAADVTEHVLLAEFDSADTTVAEAVAITASAKRVLAAKEAEVREARARAEALRAQLEGLERKYRILLRKMEALGLDDGPDDVDDALGHGSGVFGRLHAHAQMLQTHREAYTRNNARALEAALVKRIEARGGERIRRQHTKHGTPAPAAADAEHGPRPSTAAASAGVARPAAAAGAGAGRAGASVSASAANTPRAGASTPRGGGSASACITPRCYPLQHEPQPLAGSAAARATNLKAAPRRPASASARTRRHNAAVAEMRSTAEDAALSEQWPASLEKSWQLAEHLRHDVHILALEVDLKSAEQMVHATAQLDRIAAARRVAELRGTTSAAIGHASGVVGAARLPPPPGGVTEAERVRRRRSTSRAVVHALETARAQRLAGTPSSSSASGTSSSQTSTSESYSTSCQSTTTGTSNSASTS